MNVEPLTSKINLILGGFTALMTYILGEHWILFAAYLFLNAGDFLTRWIAARLTGTENSKAGAHGIVRKFGYWVIIALSFGLSIVFIEMGEVIGVNLQITAFLGWLVLSTLIINEIRSILENLVEAYGDKVPAILVRGLEAAQKAIDSVTDMTDDDKTDERSKSSEG